jgi:uncharacterized protein YndB with AHSA1/START domain
MTDRAELQCEIDAGREDVFALVSTTEGLRAWLDEAELESRVGGAVRLRLRDAEVVGKVLALDPPQHISFTWQWLDDAGLAPGIVAFDAIDHGARTHFTVRHVGLRDRWQVELHAELWRFWLRRLVMAARRLPRKAESAES